MERSRLRKISIEAHRQLKEDMRGETSTLQKRVKETTGRVYTLYYIRLVLNPDSGKYNDDIINEAVSLQQELRESQSKMNEKILQK